MFPLKIEVSSDILVAPVGRGLTLLGLFITNELGLSLSCIRG